MILEHKTYIDEVTDEIKEVFLVDGHEVDAEDYISLLEDDDAECEDCEEYEDYCDDEEDEDEDEFNELVDSILNDYTMKVLETDGCPHCIKSVLDDMLCEVYEQAYNDALDDLEDEDYE
jgi:hypothetical protein